MKRFWVGCAALIAAWTVGSHLSTNRLIDRLPTQNETQQPGKTSANSSLPAIPIGNPRIASNLETGESAEFLAYEHYSRLFQVRNAIQEYVDTRHNLLEAEKNERRVELLRQLNQLEEEDRVTAAEALVLRLALVDGTENAKEEALALIENYQQYRQAGLNHYIANPDPQFTTYKNLEAEIVKEVLALEHYPNGLTRDEYLAQRLADARAKAYSR